MSSKSVIDWWLHCTGSAFQCHGHSPEHANTRSALVALASYTATASCTAMLVPASEPTPITGLYWTVLYSVLARPITTGRGSREARVYGRYIGHRQRPDTSADAARSHVRVAEFTLIELTAQMHDELVH